MTLKLKQKRILELLSINCRFSNKDIGKAIGLSEDAVDYQINKLINEDKDVTVLSDIENISG